MIRKGSLVTLYHRIREFPVARNARGCNKCGAPSVDWIHKGEIALVLSVGKYNMKILTPHGKVGWIWIPHMEVI